MTDAAPDAALRYTLTWRDALAYERLPRPMPGLQRITFYLWLAFAGFVLFGLPEDLAGATYSPRFWLTGAVLVLFQYGIFYLVRATTRLNRARYRFPAPVEMTLEQGPGRLIFTEAGKSRVVEFEAIGMLLPTAGHLFMAVGRDLLIVPAAAFAHAGEMTALVEAIDGYMAARHGNDGAVDLAPPNA